MAITASSTILITRARQVFRGWDVPEILLGGNHEEIRSWRHRQAVEKTQRNRPDLLASQVSINEDS